MREEKRKGNERATKKRRVFISRESDEWGDARRLARNESTKPHGATLGLEAGKGAPFTRTKIILC